MSRCPHPSNYVISHVSEAAMVSNWEKPDFEVMTVGAECTAYSGSQAAMQQQSARPGPGGCRLREPV